MNESNFQYFKDTKIKFIDGDRGKNYPSKSEFFEDGCQIKKSESYALVIIYAALLDLRQTCH